MDTSRRAFLRLSSAAAGALGVAALRPSSGFASKAGPPQARASLRILILGGTGFIGPHEVRYARDRGHEVTLFNRGRTNADLFDDVETLIGDRDGQLGALEGKEWDAVIDNSGFYPRWVRDSARLLEPSVGRYLFVSSLSAYDLDRYTADHDEFTAPIATMDDPTDESDPPYGPNYGARKALCEKEVVEAFGDRAVIVRPGQIVGPGEPTDRIRYWVSRVERGGEVLVPGDPPDRVQMIDARDMTAWMVRLLEQEESGPYNATGPQAPLTMAGFVHAVRAVVSSDVRFTWVSESFLAERDLVGRYILPWAPSRLGALTRTDIRRALDTGLTYRPLAETLIDVRDELRATGPGGIEPSLFSRLGVEPERERELLAEWGARDP